MLSIVIPTSTNIPASPINAIIEQLRKQTIDPEIIVSNQGMREDEISLTCDCLIQYPCPGETFLLSKARNEGAKRSNQEWLAFTDCDIYYNEETLEEMLGYGEEAMRGCTLQNVTNIGSRPLGDPYQCGAAPLLIQRSLFEEIGGYCEAYKGWGFEDSDLEHKLKDYGSELYLFESNGYHVVSVHKKIRNEQWKQSSESNRDLFQTRRDQDVQERIKADLTYYV